MNEKETLRQRKWSRPVYYIYRIRYAIGLASLLAAPAVSRPLRAQGATIALLDYHTTVPPTWTSRTASSTMRLAEFVTPPVDGAAGAEVIVYFFGKGQGGSAESNIARWKSQFSSPDGSPVSPIVTRDSSASFPITFAELRGTYARGIGAGSSAELARPGQVLIAAIAETPSGTLFVQLFGPAASVAAQHDAFVRFVTGLRR
jgi:hypothetical protein